MLGLPTQHPEVSEPQPLVDAAFVQTNLQKIVTADYVIPEGISLSAECKDLIRRIFVVNPGMRINLDQIKTHPWFVRNLPLELQQGNLNPSIPTQVRQMHIISSSRRRRV